MRVTPKAFIRQESYFSQNNQMLSSVKDNPEDLVNIQVEQIVQNFRHYRPISDVIDIEQLKNSKTLEIKRYK